MRLSWMITATYLSLSVAAQAHDRFLKLENWRPSTEAPITVRLYNGTFVSSEKAVPRETMADVSILMPSAELSHPVPADWEDEGSISKLNIRVSEPGVYVLGLYTKPKVIELPAEKFNGYLEHDGLPDIIAARQRDGNANMPARERYSHHAKAMFQVGDAVSDAFRTPLGHPVEIIPQQHPGSLRRGQALEVLCLKDGKPIVGQYVTAGVERDGMTRLAPGVRTNEKGRATVEMNTVGVWYVKFIHMTKPDDPSLDYESQWATLTFDVTE